MAITGTLQADFSSFDAAVKSSEVKLQAFEGASNKTTAALSRLTDEIPLRFEKVGASIGAVGTVAGGTLGPVNTLGQSLSTFDGALSAVGIHIGPAVRGLTELGAASGGTIASVGALGVAGLALATGMTAWKLTRTAMEFLELDGAVAKAATSLMGYGDVAAQTAGAKQDTINAAIRRGADALISYTGAIQFNTAKQAEFQAAAQKADDAIARLEAPAKGAAQLAGWRAELDLIRTSGVLPALTADLASHNFTQKELSERYRVSIGALQEFGREVEKTDAIVQYRNDRQIAGLKEQIALSAERTKKAKDASEAEAAAAKKAQAEIDALTAAEQKELAAHKAANDEAERGAKTRQVETEVLEKVIEKVHTLAGEYISLEAAQKLRETGGSASIPPLTSRQVEALGGREGIQQQVDLGRPTMPSTFTREGWDDLVRRKIQYEQMVQYLANASDVTAAALSNLATSAAGASGFGGGVTQIVTINVNGTAADVARKVADEIMKSAKLGRRFAS